MLTRYVYTANRQLVGCVVRTDEGRLGYSAVHPKDRRKLTKKLARKIALGRAEKCEVYGFPKQTVVGTRMDWYRMRCGRNGSVVPRSVVPHLAALAALGPKGEA